MATANLFTTAKTVEGKATAGKKPVKAKFLVEGLELYAAIDHSIKWLTSLLATAKVTVVEVANDKIIADGIKVGAKPYSSFEGEEGKATGNIQIKKRSSASGLNDIEQSLATAYKVPTEEVSDRPETFIINPEHLDWINKNAAKVSAALTKLGAPEGIIQFQEATKKVVTTDDSIDFVFRTYGKQPDVIAQLLPVVASIAIKPKFEGNDTSALDTLRSLNVGE